MITLRSRLQKFYPLNRSFMKKNLPNCLCFRNSAGRLLALLILSSVFITANVFAQNGTVGIGTETPNDKAVLDIVSASKGLLIPRLTRVQRDVLQAPGTNNTEINGLLIYNVTAQRFNFWLDNQWYDISNGAIGPQGPQGLVGPAGATGPAGAAGPVGAPGPTGSQGPAGTTGPIGPAGSPGPVGAPGPAGPAGAPGPIGPKGDNGATWLSGSGAPASSLGNLNDLYLDNDLGDVYIKGSGGWVLSANIKGPVGPTPDNVWVKNGNAGTTPGTSGDFIGTRDAKDFVMATNLAERLRITSAGNVGIGVFAPSRKLEVNGTARIGVNGTTISNMIKTSTAGTIPIIAAGASQVVTFSVSGAAASSSVMISPSGALPDGLLIAYARVSAAGVVEVKFTNVSSTQTSAITQNFHLTIIE